MECRFIFSYKCDVFKLLAEGPRRSADGLGGSIPWPGGRTEMVQTSLLSSEQER